MLLEKNYGYVFDDTRFFFEDKFYETDFKKITPRAPKGSQIFDLTQILETEKLPKTQGIAELLKTKTWSLLMGGYMMANSKVPVATTM